MKVPLALLLAVVGIVLLPVGLYYGLGSEYLMLRVCGWIGLGLGMVLVLAAAHFENALRSKK
jgi:type IV secretory pathway VirB2 component (pilin)